MKFLVVQLLLRQNPSDVRWPAVRRRTTLAKISGAMNDLSMAELRSLDSKVTI